MASRAPSPAHARAQAVACAAEARGALPAFRASLLSWSQVRPSSAVPDYLFGVTLDDNTVTNASNYSLARALGIPHVGDQVRPVVGLTWSSDAPPLMGNGEAGATAGLLQYDVIDEGGEVAHLCHQHTGKHQ